MGCGSSLYSSQQPLMPVDLERCEAVPLVLKAGQSVPGGIPNVWCWEHGSATSKTSSSLGSQ